MSVRCSEFSFEVQATDGNARTGVLKLPHGEVKTPIFMPVGTQGTVKAMTPEELHGDVGAQIILGNTYHLYLRPGLEIIEAHGGLHNFMNWNHPILTDSGGYQVFSLKELRKIREDGVEFRDHISGSKHLFTPQKVVEIQETLGSDIMMAFDECPPAGATDDYLAKSLARTTRWEKECLDARTREDCSMFGIIQGGTSETWRARHLEEIAAMDFEGLAIGGLSVGEDIEAMYDTVAFTAPKMPSDRPRYLMGVGKPDDLVECVTRGIDMFDCVLPTRNARNGQCLTSEGPVVVRNAEYAKDLTPIDANCSCYVCKTYTRSYVRHLYRAKEILAARLCTWHNLHYYLNLMSGLRSAIEAGELDEFRTAYYARQGREAPCRP